MHQDSQEPHDELEMGLRASILPCIHIMEDLSFLAPSRNCEEPCDLLRYRV